MMPSIEGILSVCPVVTRRTFEIEFAERIELILWRPKREAIEASVSPERTLNVDQFTARMESGRSCVSAPARSEASGSGVT